MSIRLRRTADAGLVALCAARSVAQPGDVYLDDEVHHALGVKFADDFASEGLMRPMTAEPDHPDTAMRRAVEREESNNLNRAEWDRTFGSTPTPAAPGAPIGANRASGCQHMEPQCCGHADLDGSCCGSPIPGQCMGCEECQPEPPMPGDRAQEARVDVRARMTCNECRGALTCTSCEASLTALEHALLDAAAARVGGMDGWMLRTDDRQMTVLSHEEARATIAAMKEGTRGAGPAPAGPGECSGNAPRASQPTPAAPVREAGEIRAIADEVARISFAFSPRDSRCDDVRALASRIRDLAATLDTARQERDAEAQQAALAWRSAQETRNVALAEVGKLKAERDAAVDAADSYKAMLFEARIPHEAVKMAAIVHEGDLENLRHVGKSRAVGPMRGGALLDLADRLQLLAAPLEAPSATPPAPADEAGGRTLAAEEDALQRTGLAVVDGWLGLWEKQPDEPTLCAAPEHTRKAVRKAVRDAAIALATPTPDVAGLTEAVARITGATWCNVARQWEVPGDPSPVMVDTLVEALEVYAMQRSPRFELTPTPDVAEDAGPWLTRAADRMAHEVVRLTDSGALGTRTPLADALLDYATTRHGQTDPIGKVRATGGSRG